MKKIDDILTNAYRLEEEGDLEGAIAQLEDLKGEVDSPEWCGGKDIQHLVPVARLKAKLGRFDEAADDLDCQFMMTFVLGPAVGCEDHMGFSIPHLTEIVRVMPDNSLAAIMLGTALAREGDPAGGIPWLENGEKLALEGKGIAGESWLTNADKQTIVLRVSAAELSQAHMQQRNVGAAEAALRRQVARCPEDGDTIEELAEFLFKDERRTESWELYRRASLLDPSRMWPLVRMGSAGLLLKDLPKAEEGVASAYRMALENDVQPGDRRATDLGMLCRGMSTEYYDRGDMTPAAEWMERAAWLCPDRTDWAELAVALRSQVT